MSRRSQWQRSATLLTWISLLSVPGAAAAASPPTSRPASEDSRIQQWRTSLQKCEWSSAGGLLFVDIFSGFWPLPTDFVVLAPPRDGVELTPLRIDRGPSSLARAYVLSKSQYEKLWSADVQRWSTKRQVLGGGLFMKRGVFRAEFPLKVTRFAVIADGEAHLLLYGVVADVAEDMLNCFQRLRKRVTTR